MRGNGPSRGRDYECGVEQPQPFELHERRLSDLEPIGSRENQRDRGQWGQRSRQRRVFQVENAGYRGAPAPKQACDRGT